MRAPPTQEGNFFPMILTRAIVTFISLTVSQKETRGIIVHDQATRPRDRAKASLVQ
jgi:hypothetical protein